MTEPKCKGCRNYKLFFDKLMKTDRWEAGYIKGLEMAIEIIDKINIDTGGWQCKTCLRVREEIFAKSKSCEVRRNERKSTV